MFGKYVLKRKGFVEEVVEKTRREDVVCRSGWLEDGPRVFEFEFVVLSEPVLKAEFEAVLSVVGAEVFDRCRSVGFVGVVEVAVFDGEWDRERWDGSEKPAVVLMFEVDAEGLKAKRGFLEKTEKGFQCSGCSSKGCLKCFAEVYRRTVSQ